MLASQKPRSKLQAFMKITILTQSNTILPTSSQQQHSQNTSPTTTMQFKALFTAIAVMIATGHAFVAPAVVPRAELENRQNEVAGRK